ncbi:MAG: response regulator [Myxococcota bacterium]
MNVLIVDDSKAMRLIVKRTLRQAGLGDLTVHEAENGRDALNKLDDASPDLILSDLNMPEMNGMELLREIRASGSKVRFGLVTSEGSTDVRSAALDAGANFMVVKPFTADSFKAAFDGANGNGVRSTAQAGAGELPTPEAIKGIVDSLLSPDVVVKKGKLVRPDARRPVVGVRWGADDGTLEVFACVHADLAIAAGCALTSLPANAVAEHVKATTSAGLPEALASNVNEVFNVLGTLFIGELPGSGKLRQIEAPLTAFPDDVTKQIRKPLARLDVEISVAGYGEGGATFFRLA